MKIARLIFNPLQENTYVVWDDTLEAVVIDAGNMSEKENATLEQFLSERGLKPVYALNTHGHFDHLMGVEFLRSRYGAKFAVSSKDKFLVESAKQNAAMFGIGGGNIVEVVDVDLDKSNEVKIKEIQTFKKKKVFIFNIKELICLRCSKKNYGIWVDLQKEYEEILKALRKKMDLCMMILLQNEVNHIKQLVIPNKLDLYQPGVLKFSWFMGSNNQSHRYNQKLSNSILKQSIPNLQTIK